MADLIIIGNGFDLAHGIKSKYSDFKNYVKNTLKEDTDIMDTYFSTKADFWSDVENALSNYDLNNIQIECAPNFDIMEEEEPFKAAYIVEDGPDANLSPVAEELKEWFKKWVDSINISGIQKNSNYNLKSGDLYLTFNYTETLEQVYNVPEANVLHIHGKKGDPVYVFGHNNPRDVNSIDSEKELPWVETAKRRIIEIMNTFDKKSEDIIRSNQSFFGNLGNIGKVITYGHSLNKIDWPYFEEIVNKTGKGKEWELHSHNQEDVNSAVRLIDNFGLANAKIIYPS